MTVARSQVRTQRSRFRCACAVTNGSTVLIPFDVSVNGVEPRVPRNSWRTVRLLRPVALTSLASLVRTAPEACVHRTRTNSHQRFIASSLMQQNQKTFALVMLMLIYALGYVDRMA